MRSATMEQNEPNRKFGRNKNYGNVVAGFKCNVVSIFISTQCILRIGCEFKCVYIESFS